MEPDIQDVELQFMGGAGTVTGSKTLVRCGATTLLVDCGLFQGIKRRRRRNWQPLPVDPSGIDCVLLTHGHLDHVGYLPRLVREGFEGGVLASAPTLDVARVILEDSARIQEEDAHHANREGYSQHDPAEPLYTVEDARRCFEQFEPVAPGEPVPLGEAGTARFRPNGHILGSCLIELEFNTGRLVFSGDMGRPDSLLHEPPAVPSQADWLVLESTYGDRLHLRRDPEDILQEVVQRAREREGQVIIPSFALGRAQQLMYLLHRLKDQGRIPDCPLFLDSPMGVNITELYRKHTGWHKLSAAECDSMCRDVELIRDFGRTRNVLKEPGTKIIIAGSGMLTGGRVLFYLERLLDDPSTIVLLTGYQAEGTRGRLLQEGAHELKFHGTYHPVNAEVRELSSLSAHADQAELIEWLRALPSEPRSLFLNHGEPQSSQALRVKIRDELNWGAEPVKPDETRLLPGEPT